MIEQDQLTTDERRVRDYLDDWREASWPTDNAYVRAVAATMQRLREVHPDGNWPATDSWRRRHRRVCRLRRHRRAETLMSADRLPSPVILLPGPQIAGPQRSGRMAPSAPPSVRPGRTPEVPPQLARDVKRAAHDAKVREMERGVTLTQAKAAYVRGHTRCGKPWTEED